jgi:very-short-patch-repair endonuclease
MKTLKQLMAYKLKNSRKPTVHEKMFSEIIQSVKADMLKENIYIGRLVEQRIFMDIKSSRSYLADAYLPLMRLVFEIDGPNHEKTTDYDRKRTEFINTRRCIVVRFKNHEVEQLGIKDKIKEIIRERHKHLGMNSKATLTKSSKCDGNDPQHVREFINNGGKITVCPPKTKKNRL